MPYDLPELLESCQNIRTPAVLDVQQSLLVHSELQRALKSLGYEVVLIDNSPVTDKQSLLSALSRECHFPEYFGFNWDGLKDCLCSTSWRTVEPKGYIFLFLNPLMLGWSDLSVFLSIIETSKMLWSSYGVPFKLLLPEYRSNKRFAESS